VNQAFPIGLRKEHIAGKTAAELRDVILEKVKRAYEAKAANENPDALKAIERLIVLNALDRLWQEHLYNMDQLRDGIGLRAYGQKDPLVEYKTEAFAMFDEMQDNVKNEIANNVFRSASSLAAFENFLRALPTQLSGPDLDSGSALGHQGLNRQVPRLAKTSLKKPSKKPRRPFVVMCRKLAATSRVPAAAARNTRTAAEETPERSTLNREPSTAHELFRRSKG